MIRMTAEIALLKGSGDITLISIDPTNDGLTGNNISSKISDVVSVSKYGSNPFIFGASLLGSGATFSDGEDYFIGSELSDKDTGIFPTEHTLAFNIANPTSGYINFSILFDTYNNAYPTKLTVKIYAILYSTEIKISSETLNNDSPYFLYTRNVIFQTGYQYMVVITIPNWSAYGYPLRVQGVYTGLSLYIDKRNLNSISAPIKDRSDNEQPSYGIISNSGNITFIDSTGEVEDYARRGLLKTDLDVQLWLEDSLTKKKQSIGKFKTDKWSYDNMNFEVNVDLKDDLEEWQNIGTIENDLSPLMLNKTGEYLYEFLKSFIPLKYILKENDNLINYLKNIQIPYFYIESNSLWEQWNKFCNLTGSHIYENENKEIVIYSDFGG